MKRSRRYEDSRRALVTDHAIVRYIERVMGVPELVEMIVDDLLADGREKTIPNIHASTKVRVGGRMQLTISCGHVVTVMSMEKEKGK